MAATEAKTEKPPRRAPTPGGALAQRCAVRTTPNARVTADTFTAGHVPNAACVASTDPPHASSSKSATLALVYAATPTAAAPDRPLDANAWTVALPLTANTLAFVAVAMPCAATPTAAAPEL